MRFSKKSKGQKIGTAISVDSKDTEILLAVAICFLLAFEKKVVFPAIVMYLRLTLKRGAKISYLNLAGYRKSKYQDPVSPDARFTLPSFAIGTIDLSNEK